MAKATFKDKYSGNLLTVDLPVDINAMRADANWVEILPDGTELDRYKPQREEWDIPFQSSERAGTAPAKRGKK